jgi:hypothetical protein
MGWYFGHTRPMPKDQRELMQQHEQAWAKRRLPDDMAATVDFGAFMYLEMGALEEAKGRLLGSFCLYYRVYHDNGGDPNIIAQIEHAAQKYPAIAAEISKKFE